MNWHKIDPKDKKTWPGKSELVLTLSADEPRTMRQGDWTNFIKIYGITHYCIIESPGSETCVWKESPDQIVYTKCGKPLSSKNYDLIQKWGMEFCCFCGKPLVQGIYKKEDV